MAGLRSLAKPKVCMPSSGHLVSFGVAGMASGNGVAYPVGHRAIALASLLLPGLVFAAVSLQTTRSLNPSFALFGLLSGVVRLLCPSH
jgi:hypothetical protein